MAGRPYWPTRPARLALRRGGHRAANRLLQPRHPASAAGAEGWLAAGDARLRRSPDAGGHRLQRAPRGVRAGVRAARGRVAASGTGTQPPTAATRARPPREARARRKRPRADNRRRPEQGSAGGGGRPARRLSRQPTRPLRVLHPRGRGGSASAEGRRGARGTPDWWWLRWPRAGTLSPDASPPAHAREVRPSRGAHLLDLP